MVKFDEWPLKLIIKTLMPGEPFGPPGIVYISGGAILQKAYFSIVKLFFARLTFGM